MQAKKTGDGAQAELAMQTKLANGYKKKATCVEACPLAEAACPLTPRRELRRKANHLDNVIKERDAEM